VVKEVLRTAKLDYIGLVDANRHSLAWEYLGEIPRPKKVYDTGVIIYKIEMVRRAREEMERSHLTLCGMSVE
jgi:hypothetical protein